MKKTKEVERILLKVKRLARNSPLRGSPDPWDKHIYDGYCGAIRDVIQVIQEETEADTEVLRKGDVRIERKRK